MVITLDKYNEKILLKLKEQFKKKSPSFFLTTYEIDKDLDALIELLISAQIDKFKAEIQIVKANLQFTFIGGLLERDVLEFFIKTLQMIEKNQNPNINLTCTLTKLPNTYYSLKLINNKINTVELFVFAF